MLNERLQPSLLDRLIDEERLLTLYELTVQASRLQALGVEKADLRATVIASGLSFVSDVAASETEDVCKLSFCAPSGRVSISQLNALVLECPGEPQGMALERVCRIEAHNVLNTIPENSSQRASIAGRLRELVSRDLSLLLNATSLEAVVDLNALSCVRASVLNFGLPSLAGLPTGSINTEQLARKLESVIRGFEPRLTKVRVTHDPQQEQEGEPEICFLIDAQLWDQTAPHQVMLRTRISTASGKAQVQDLGGRK
jgi:type VI secretion system protein ImpF